ncbi:DUF6221 family protein [Streptomyces tendae]
MSTQEVLPAALYDFLRTRLADDEALSAAELHAKMRIIRAWPDPFGNWTADQADAAKAMKDQIIRAMAAVYCEHPDYRDEWR